MVDGSTAVIEVRRGNEYRASVIELIGRNPVVGRELDGVLAAVAGICPDRTTTPYFPKYCTP